MGPHHEQVCPVCRQTFGAGHLVCPDDGARLRRYLVGRIVHGRTVEALLDVGPAGLIYRARNVGLDREEALEALDPLVGVEQIERFRREMQARARLRTLGLPRLYEIALRSEAGDDPGAEVTASPFVFRELIVGRTLEALLADGPMPAARAATLVAPLADALAAAHREGLVHGALRPSALRILGADDAAIPCLLGFALTRPAADDLELAAWAAPEVFDGATPTRHADLYGLGLLLYTLLTGANPRADVDPSAGAFARVEAEVPPLPVDEPPGLDELLRAMLAREVSERMGDAARVRPCLEALELVPSAAGLAAAHARLARAEARARRGRWPGVAVGVAGLAAAAVAWTTRAPAPPAAPPAAHTAAAAITPARTPDAPDAAVAPTDAAPAAADAARPPPDAAGADAAIPPQRFPPLPDVEPTFDLARVPTDKGPLYVARTELTRGDWQHITGRPAPGKGTPRHPVTGVTLADVTAVLNAASEAEGLKPCYRCEADGYCPPDAVDAAECEGYRLPTLAEWRAIVAVAAPDGPPPDDRAVYWSPEREKGALPVCSRGPDAAGLCDLFGNVWEWSGEQARKRVWLRTGGSWQHTRDEAENPVGHKEGYGVRYLGARPVRSPREPARVTLGAITLDLLSRSLERRDGRSRPLGDDFALVLELVGQNGGPVALDAFDNRPPAAVRAGLVRVQEALEVLGGDLRLVVRDGAARLYRR